jgi:hypothetical protein
MNKKIFSIMMFGAAIVWMTIFISNLIPDNVYYSLSNLPIINWLGLEPLIGAISILAVNYIFKKTGFMVV